MGARRSLACPSCGAERTTKAIGRQKLTCGRCGASFLAASAKEFEPRAEPSTNERGGEPETPAKPEQPAGLGGVKLEPPVRLKLPKGGLAETKGGDAPASADPSDPPAKEAQGGAVGPAPDPPPRKATPAPKPAPRPTRRRGPLPWLGGDAA